MAQTIKKKTLFAVAVMASAVIGGAIVATLPASADEADVRLQEVYALGEQITVPDKMLSDGGEEYPAEVVVVYPNGRAYRTQSFFADQLGRYTVEYRATTPSGKYLTETVTFETQSDLFTVDGENSSASYGLDDSAYQTGREGLRVSLAPGDTFTYHDVVDLREIGAQNTFIELFMTPTTGAGTRDVGAIVVKLQDVHDPENVVTVYGRSAESDGGGDPWWCNTTYLSAGSAGTTATGIEWGPPMKIHTSKFGFPISYSMYGNRNFQNSVGQETFGIKMDLEEKRVYGPKDSGDNYVIDLDEKKYFSKTWQGFTTGEVRISVSAETYFTDQFDFVITKIGNSDIGAERLRDSKPPKITVQANGYSLSALPDASVGVAYPVFGATASDVCSPTLPVTTKVFYNYHSTTRYELPVKNGAFTPDRAGEYTVEYTAKDYYGNVETVVGKIHCTAEAQQISITANSPAEEGLVGNAIAYDCFSVVGGIGRVEKNVSITLDGQTVQTQDGTFFPTVAGTYRVVCSATDMVGQTAERTYEISVLQNPDPVFLQEAILPKLFFQSIPYRFDALQAFDFQQNAWVDATLTVTDANGTILAADGAYTFTAGSQSATLVYTATTQSGTATKEYTVPVRSAYQGANVDLPSFFLTQSAQIQAMYTGIRFTKTSAEEMTAEYPVPLHASQRDASFSVNGNVEEILLTYTDFSDVGDVLGIQLKKDRTGQLFRMYVDGVDTGIAVAKSHRLNVEFVDGNVKLNGTAFPVGNRGVGERGCRFAFSVKGEQGASVTVSSLGGKALHLGLTDTFAPYLALSDAYASYYPLNTGLNVVKARAFDLHSPVTACTVTVVAPDGSIAYSGQTALSGVDAQGYYTVSLQSYGTYSVHYDVTDAFGNTARTTFRFSTTDNVPPEIQIGYTERKTFRVGELVTFGKAVATDDRGGTCKIDYFIVMPNGEIAPIFFIKVAESAMTLSFRAEEAGTYLIRYFAVDEAGNVAIHDEEIVVE